MAADSTNEFITSRNSALRRCDLIAYYLDARTKLNGEILAQGGAAEVLFA
jgi:hypothetical protein